jgi:hypothetical protein
MIIEPSAAELFGSGTRQDALTVTFRKADLPTLTASATNNGQQLFVGLFLAVLTRQRAITTPTGEILKAPGGERLTYPVEQSAIRLEWWRIVPHFRSQEYIYTLDIWS